MDINQTKTEFIHSELNMVDATLVDVELAARTPITAGKWKSVIEYQVSLVEIPLPAGLYDENNVMLCTWEESGIDINTDYTINNYRTEAASPYYVMQNNYPTTVKVVIPDTCTKIGNFSFASASNLTTITIPGSVENIGQNAFSGCTSLTSATLEDGVQTIGTAAFSGCTGLTTVTLPDSVSSIGANAFAGCQSLTSISLPSNITDISDFTFQGCTSLISVVIPSNVTNIGQNAFAGCTNSSLDITIPDSVTSIGNSAFGGVPHITYNGSATGSPWSALSVN